MHRVIAGATGLIGRRLVEHWLKQQHTITVIGRSTQRIKDLFDDRVQAVTWDKLTVDTIKSAELIVNLTGENVGGARWSESRKKEILNSRVGSTKKIVNLLCQIEENIPRLFNASAIGVYGLQKQLPEGLPPAFDEDAAIDWERSPDFLAQVARRWEKAAEPAILHGARVVFLRFGVVLASDGGALPEFMKPFKFFLGGSFGTGKQPFSWVAIDDVVHAIDFLASKSEITGAFNIVAPECVSQKVFAKTLGNVMGKPSLMRFPAFLLRPVMGEMAHDLLFEGQHVYPKRLFDLGFKFSYPELESALNHVLREPHSLPKAYGKRDKAPSLMDKVKSMFTKK